MPRTPRGWTDEQARQWHQLHRDLDGVRGMPLTDNDLQVLAYPYVIQVIEHFEIDDPENPPTHFQLATWPEPNSLIVHVTRTVALLEGVYVDDNHAVVLDRAGLAQLRWIQTQWPKEPIAVHYSPRRDGGAGRGLPSGSDPTTP